MTKVPILLLFLLLFHLPSAAQACGYIFAKLDIRNSNGISLADAKLEFLGRDTNKPIVYVKKELAYSPEASAFKLRHGMCGSHYGTRLVIRHDGYETLERTVDLSLNGPRAEHAFVIVLKRKGSTETASIEQLAALHGSVEDARGKPYGRAALTLIGSDGTRFDSTSDANGMFSFSVRRGTYLLETARSGGKKFRINLNLVPGPMWETIKLDDEP